MRDALATDDDDDEAKEAVRRSCGEAIGGSAVGSAAANGTGLTGVEFDALLREWGCTAKRVSIIVRATVTTGATLANADVVRDSALFADEERDEERSACEPIDIGMAVSWGGGGGDVKTAEGAPLPASSPANGCAAATRRCGCAGGRTFCERATAFAPTLLTGGGGDVSDADRRNEPRPRLLGDPSVLAGADDPEGGDGPATCAGEADASVFPAAEVAAPPNEGAEDEPLLMRRGEETNV